MKAVVQRVSNASVTVDGDVAASIDLGLLVLLGVHQNDTVDDAHVLARKVVGLRLFEDGDGKMNLSLSETEGSLLCVSQFTLYGDVRRGRRPSFDEAAPPLHARQLYEAFCNAVRDNGIECQQGRFGAHMAVTLTNDGPVTLVVDTEVLRSPRRA